MLQIFGTHGDYSASFDDDGSHAGFALKPCPFCGSTDVELGNTHSASYSIECLNCDGSIQGERKGAQRPRTKLACEAAHRQAMRSAADKWNRRVGA